MKTSTIVVLFCIWFETSAAKDDQKPTLVTIQNQSDQDQNRIVGVATVAGMTTRNGRISSLGAIKVYPGSGSIRVNNGQFYPITVSAEKDGRYASGTVQVYPGYASASARAGYAPTQDGQFFQNRPNELFIQSPPHFGPAKQFENWFPKEIFKSISLPRPNYLRNEWFYPSFNPFVNFWR